MQYCVKKYIPTLLKDINEVLPPVPMGTCSHVWVHCKEHFPATAGLPHPFEQTLSLLVLYIRRASSVQEGLHNLFISLHKVWGDRDKPLETKEIFTGCIAGLLVVWAKPMLCPLLPSQELQASSAGGGLEEVGSKHAGEIWMGQIWSLFALFSSWAEG